METLSAEVSRLRERLQTAAVHQLALRENALGKAAASLEALSPLKVLSRGYTVTSMNGKTVSDPSVLREGDTLETRFAHGIVHSAVTDVQLQ